MDQRPQWRQAAWRVEQARETTGHRDPQDALGSEPHEKRAREAWHDAQREIQRYRRDLEATTERAHETSPGRELA